MEEGDRPAHHEEEEDENASDGGGSTGSDDDDDDEDEEDDHMAHLPAYVISRVGKLRELNEKQDEIMETYLQERAALEQKFSAKLQPLWDERAGVIRGDKDDEIEASSPKAEDDAAAATENNGDQPKVKGIPQFWLCAMTNIEVVGELITEADVDCLEKLLDITCVDDKDGKGFTLKFHFAPNDYFHDSVLTKRYEVPNLLLSDEPILKNVSGCTIQWKPDRSLTYRQIKKKQRGKGKNAGQVRTVTKKEDKESFFRWFEPPKLPSMDTMDEEEAEAVEELFDNDYEVAQSFRKNIIPQAVLWFTGEAAEQEMLDAMGEEGLNQLIEESA